MSQRSGHFLLAAVLPATLLLFPGSASAGETLSIDGSTAKLGPNGLTVKLPVTITCGRHTKPGPHDANTATTLVTAEVSQRAGHGHPKPFRVGRGEATVPCDDATHHLNITVKATSLKKLGYVGGSGEVRRYHAGPAYASVSNISYDPAHGVGSGTSTGKNIRIVP